MDQPGLEPAAHRQALRGLDRINRISGTARHFWPELEKLSTTSEKRTLRVLDAACGGGDVAIALRETAKRRRVALEVDGCDLSPTALEYARKRAAQRGAEVGFFEHDVIEHRLPQYDAVVCSLFLHHLSESQAVSFLVALRASAIRLVQISDLLRSRLGYAFAVAGCQFLTRSPVVRTDGPRSVAAAFTLEEMTDLATRAGLDRANILRRFPERFLLTWRRS